MSCSDCGWKNCGRRCGRGRWGQSDLAAQDRALRLEIREAALLGLDAPKEVKHSGAVDLNKRPDFSQLTPAELSALRDAVTKVQPAEIVE